MDAQELEALHQRDAYAHAAIKGCVHDLACRCGRDRLHSRSEIELLRLSLEMTEHAKHNGLQPDQPTV
jgi:hypothetical protein